MYRVLIAPRVGRGHAHVVFVHVGTQEECRGTDKCEGDKEGLGIDYMYIASLFTHTETHRKVPKLQEVYMSCTVNWLGG